MYDPTADLGLRRRLDDCIARQQILEQQIAVRDGQIERLQSALAEAVVYRMKGVPEVPDEDKAATVEELKEAWRKRPETDQPYDK